MNSTGIATLTILALGSISASFASTGELTPAALAGELPSEVQPTNATAAPALHCQVPCGIYGDQMRIDMLMEDAATIEKGMKMLIEMDAAESPSKNQIVRWVVAKEEHAQKIQDQVAAYWLAQRIKAPADGTDEAATSKYVDQLVTLHGITVAAMKCKQTTEVAHVQKLRELALGLSKLYFSEEDHKHIEAHHGSEHR